LVALPLPVMCRLIVPTGVHLRPGAEVGKEAAVDLRRRGAAVAMDLLKEHRVNTIDGLVQFLQPRPKAQERHAATFVPAGTELHGAMRDHAVSVAHRPASGLSEVESEDDLMLEPELGSGRRAAGFG
jgi:hypothetical protein